jgi:hypothetical protein
MDSHSGKELLHNLYMGVTYKWLCQQQPEFSSVSFEEHTTLICGKPQSGKSMFSFSIALMYMLLDIPVVFITRNMIQDAMHIIEKLKRFSVEHKKYMQKIGFDYSFTLKTLFIGECQKNTINNDLMTAMTSSKKIIIALANGFQLKCINEVITQFEGGIKFALITDEADVVGYSAIKSETKITHHKAFEYYTLYSKARYSFEISATVWDILAGNRNLTNTNIITLKPSSDYKGIRNSIQFVSLEFPIQRWEMGMSIFEEDENLTYAYDEMTNTEIFTQQRYNCPVLHPVICLHKTRRELVHHRAFLNEFRRSKFGKTWTIITECDYGLYMYNPSIKKITICGETYTETKGYMDLGRKIIIPQLLQWFIENGGANVFSHIVIKSGDFSGRSRSYVSTDGKWHLTHQYYNGKGNIPSKIQSQRLLHNRPDSIPLVEYASIENIRDIKLGDMIQDEQLDRLRNRKNIAETCELVKNDIWNCEKIPKAKLCTGNVNIAFKLQSDSVDNGWSIETYESFLGSAFVRKNKNKDSPTFDDAVNMVRNAYKSKGSAVQRIIDLFIGTNNQPMSVDELKNRAEISTITNYDRWDLSSAKKYRILEKNRDMVELCPLAIIIANENVSCQ